VVVDRARILVVTGPLIVPAGAVVTPVHGAEVVVRRALGVIDAVSGRGVALVDGAGGGIIDALPWFSYGSCQMRNPGA
jgi:hypothetical protein